MRTLLLLALWATLPVGAQTLEARRYRTAEGVEVLTSRAAPAPAVVASAPAVQPPAPPVPVPEARRIPPDTQTERDRERFAILNAELMTEAKALSTKRQALGSPRASQDLTGEQLQALRDSIAAHEENIRAIDREIRRLPAAVVTGRMAELQPAALRRVDGR